MLPHLVEGYGFLYKYKYVCLLLLLYYVFQYYLFWIRMAESGRQDHIQELE